ncbi:MAG: phosphatase PAP2 family protein [Myxococcales bacterium]|nr:phosphatase PAP2 family protein [Myxococcales bacterium]MCB9577399.1 phosphatase PAP2 family protein [Polyangiaceae bacterium]
MGRAERLYPFGVIALRWLSLSAGAVVFATLAVELHTPWVGALDERARAVAMGFRSDGLTDVMQVITFLGNGWSLGVVAALVAGFEFFDRHRKVALFVVTASVGAGLLNALLKLLFARPRPDVALRLAAAGGYSFPSGHSMASAAIVTTLMLVVIARRPRLRALAIVVGSALIVAIGISRVYLGVHYASDVIAGWALGASWPLWLRPLLLVTSQSRGR